MVELGGADIAGVGLGEDGDEHSDTPVVVEQTQHQANSSQHHHPAKPNNFNRLQKHKAHESQHHHPTK